MLERRRPGSPAAAVDLGEGAEGGVVRQLSAFPVTVLVELDSGLRCREKLLQGSHLEAEDTVTLDKPLPVQIASRAHQLRQPLPEPGRARYFFDPDVQGIAVAPARGVVRAGLLRQQR